MKELDKKSHLFVAIWLIVALAWISAFPFHSAERLDFQDIAIEGSTLFASLLIFLLIRNLPPLLPGWGIFLTALTIDFLDEFTSEPEFFNTTLEGILKITGLLMLFFGFLKAYSKLEVEVREVEESAEWFKKLVEITPVPCIVYKEGKFVYVNKATEEATGYTREELLREVFWELFDEEEEKKVREVIKKRLAGEEVEPYILRVRRKDGGYRILRAFGTSVEWKGERYGIVAFADVTELEEERRKSEELSKMISLINSILRHDVLNALTTASAYMELHKEGAEEACSRVEQAIERAINVVKNLRDFEEVVKKGELRIMSAKGVAEEVAKGFSIPIIVEGDCNVVADEGLKTIFENLFQNAVQHSGTDRIEVRIKRVGANCEIRVADFGKGIPEEIKGRIFEEGFKHGERAGTGFGLYVVKKLVERYGGEIKVENNEPSGTVFVLRLRAV